MNKQCECHIKQMPFFSRKLFEYAENEEAKMPDLDSVELNKWSLASMYECSW